MGPSPVQSKDFRPLGLDCAQHGFVMIDPVSAVRCLVLNRRRQLGRTAILLE